MQPPSHHDSTHSGAAGSEELPPPPHPSTLSEQQKQQQQQQSPVASLVDSSDEKALRNGESTTYGTGRVPPHASHAEHKRQNSRGAGSAKAGPAGNGASGHGWSSHGNIGMGDGIVNQSMKEDLENWIAAIGLAPNVPVHVVGYFGQSKDLTMFERVSSPVIAAASEDDGEPTLMSDEDDRTPVYGADDPDDECESDGDDPLSSRRARVWAMGVGDQRTTGDIQLYVDRAKNTLMLQHAYLYDTQEMLPVCLESLDTVKKDRASMMKWMHDQEFESHRALLFLFLISQTVVLTSPSMNIDPQMISVLLALSAIKRQIMQEMDRFMTICWDRIGVSAPALDQNSHNSQHHHHHGGGSGGGSGARGGPNLMAHIFTPGRCVPVLVFVVERVPVTVPWHDPGASESQITEHLRQQVLKKSVDALQTRLRYVFRACRLIQSIDPPAGLFDARQLFVLPSPSSTPFVHVIPHFTEQVNLPPPPPTPTPVSAPAPSSSSTVTSVDGVSILDPAEEVLRQKMLLAQTGGIMSKKYRDRKTGASTSATTAVATVVAGEMTPVTAFSTRRTSLLDIPTLREMYDVTVQTRDQSLTQAGGRGNGGTRTKRRGSGSGPGLGPSAVSLGSLYLDYTGPLLRQFVDSWVKSVSQPGGYGNVVGKRNAGNVEVPTLQQWMAGCLGVCEALGLRSLATPQLTVVASDNKDIGRNNNNNSSSSIIDDTNVDRTEQEPQRSSEDHTAAMTTKLSKLSVAGVGAGSGQGRRSGNGKRYSQRCANIVQKKVLDYVLTDDVMEELYGQKPDLAATTTTTTTRAHSERYHQLKAEQASKLFQTLAHRR